MILEAHPIRTGAIGSTLKKEMLKEMILKISAQHDI